MIIVMPIRWYGIILLVFGVAIFFGAAVRTGNVVGMLVGAGIAGLGFVFAFVRLPTRTEREAKKARERRQNHPLQSETKPHCNHCGKVIQDDAQVCAYCGKRVGVARTIATEGHADARLASAVQTDIGKHTSKGVAELESSRSKSSAPDRRPRNSQSAVIPGETPGNVGLTVLKKGDVIGDRFEVRGLLGRGGFGEVYLVYHRAVRTLVALKTIRSEFLTDSAAKDAFRKEALTWVHLERHPCILYALGVHEFLGRLFVVMEYIAPDSQGRVTLADHLAKSDGPLDRVQTLKWALELSDGMEHAYRHGITCHRDIKPSNILITQDKTVMISDFGLALAAEVALRGQVLRFSTDEADGSFGLSLVQNEAGKEICGTPGYMAPEVVLGRGADVRSDIYSFGLVLWQMAAGSRVPPFHVPVPDGGVGEYVRAVLEGQMRGRVPNVGGEIQHIIERCLEPDPARRYKAFAEMRREVEFLLRTKWGIVGGPPTPRDHERAGFWNNKGSTLYQLGQHEEAIACFSKGLEIDPSCADAWAMKGGVLCEVGRRDEAVLCYSKAVDLNPKDTDAWLRLGENLDELGRYRHAIACCDRALEVAPAKVDLWNLKGTALYKLDLPNEALGCFTKALDIDPHRAPLWFNKGLALYRLDRHHEAVECFSKSLEIDSRDAGVWFNKGIVLGDMQRLEEAVDCFAMVVEIDSKNTQAWCQKAIVEERCGNMRAAAISWRRFLDLARNDPAETHRIKEIEAILAELEAAL